MLWFFWEKAKKRREFDAHINGEFITINLDNLIALHVVIKRRDREANGGEVKSGVAERTEAKRYSLSVSINLSIFQSSTSLWPQI